MWYDVLDEFYCPTATHIFVIVLPGMAHSYWMKLRDTSNDSLALTEIMLKQRIMFWI